MKTPKKEKMQKVGFFSLDRRLEYFILTSVVSQVRIFYSEPQARRNPEYFILVRMQSKYAQNILFW
jgi:hypothetical protein